MTLRKNALAIFVAAYAAASALHYGHNAWFLREYPNMPPGLSAAQVHLAWLGVTTVGMLGYGVFLTRRRLGLVVLALYAVLGFDGLSHYALAAPSRHTLTMNATIWLEAGTAALLLAAVARFMFSRGVAGGAEAA